MCGIIGILGSSDVSDRLIEAAGVRMFEQIPETGEKVMKFTQAVLGDHPEKTIEKGVKIIEKGEKTVRRVTGILDGILGGGGETDEEEEK